MRRAGSGHGLQLVTCNLEEILACRLFLGLHGLEIFLRVFGSAPIVLSRGFISSSGHDLSLLGRGLGLDEWLTGFEPIVHFGV